MQWGKRRTSQKAQAGGDATLVAGDLNFYEASTPARPVEWPVRVGAVPRRATAFQPRTAARDQAIEARAQGRDVVLSGHGGVGKSQLAASLTRDIQGDLAVRVWAAATSTDQITTAYAHAARQLGLAEETANDETGAAKAFMRWLGSTERRWLVVLDNVADPDAVTEWWPDSDAGNGWVVATTRRVDAQLSAQGRALVRLGTYTPEEAREFLSTRLTDAGQSHLYDPDQADEIARELGYLPLALGYAAAFLINQRRTMVDYLAMLRDKSHKLGDVLPSSADAEGYGRSVAVSLTMSVDAVACADNTGLTRPLLELVALADPTGHPAALWTTPAAISYLSAVRPAREGQHLPPVTQSEVQAAIDSLRTYALLAQDISAGPIRMHALTGRAVREAVPAPALAVMVRAVADAIVDLWPRFDHLERDLATSLRINALHLDPFSWLSLWKPVAHECILKVSASLYDAGLYQQAADYDHDVLRRGSEIHGRDDHQTLVFRSFLAASYAKVGRVREAVDLGERVLSDLRQDLGKEHPVTISSCTNLAVYLEGAGELQEALDLREQTLLDSEEFLGVDHPDTLTACNNLAISYESAGRVREALELREKTLAARDRDLGRGHPDTLMALSNLANSYDDMGRIQEALALREEVLSARERVLGCEHPDTLAARHNLAASYGRAGRVREALKLCKHAHAVCERTLGHDHPYALMVRGSLASLYARRGWVQKAVELGERVVEDYARLVGDGHPDTLVHRGNLANFYGQAGWFQESAELSEKLQGDFEQTLGRDHPSALSSRSILALSYRELGRIREALELSENVLLDRERVLSSDHPDTVAERERLADLRHALQEANLLDEGTPDAPSESD